MKGSCVVCDLRDREKMMAVRRGNGFNRITMVYVLLLVSYTFLKLICAKSTFILCLYKYVCLVFVSPKNDLMAEKIL